MSGRGAPALPPARSLRALSLLRAPSLRALSMLRAPSPSAPSLRVAALLPTRSLRVPALLVLSLLAAPVLPATALADAPLFIVEPSQMPFDLGPGAPPASRRGPGTCRTPRQQRRRARQRLGHPRQRPDNPSNLPGGGRTIWAGDEPIGYYTRNGGTLNLFDRRGRRIAYRPGGGRTKSLFSPQEPGAAPWRKPPTASPSA